MGPVNSKNTLKDSIFKKIYLGAVYVKPSSMKKTALIDHIADVNNTLQKKDGRGLHWILAGDTNVLKLGLIQRLNSKLKSIAKKVIRINPKTPHETKILDNIMTDLRN